MLKYGLSYVKNQRKQAHSIFSPKLWGGPQALAHCVDLQYYNNF